MRFVENPLRSSPIPYVGWLAIVFGYAVFKYGGVVSADWNFCLVALGLLALLYCLSTPRIGLAPRPHRWLSWPIVMLPGYVILQLIPLPVFLLRILSPARAELLDALKAAAPGAGYGPLSVIPSNTLVHLLRIVAYTVVFMLMREISWRWERRQWAPAFPIIAVGAMEAALGLFQYSLGPPGGFGRGTYVNRSHFAGLLEMALPFAVMYPVAIIRRPRSLDHLPSGAALRVCAMSALAALIFLGIIYSFSRMGFVASLCSLLVMGTATLAACLPGRKRWIALVLAPILAVSGFVFLAPDPLVRRFAKLDTQEEVTIGGRVLIWKDTARLIKAYPVFGCGLGGYEAAFEKFNVSMPRFGVDFAHNDYLQLLAELGVIGFAIFAALMLGIIALAVRAAFRHSELEARCLGLACVSAMVAILVHSIVDFNLYITANALLLAWVSGIAAGLQFSSRPRPVRDAVRVPAVVEVCG